MDKVNVSIHIIPSDQESQMALESYNPKRDGRIQSSVSEIKVNRCINGYSIVFIDEVFEELNPAQFVASMISLFNKNLHNTMLSVTMQYHYDDESFDEDTAEAVIRMDDMMLRVMDSGQVLTFGYNGTVNIDEVFKDWKDATEGDSDGSDDDDDDGLFDSDDPLGFFLDRNDDEDDEKPHRHHKYDYPHSRVWREAKNPKRAIRRHGVLIAASKGDLKKDEKILKEFLKEFLPGNAEWKREFRSDVAKRWMQMFAISKKQLKHLERQHRKAKARKNKKSSNTEKALDFTRRLFSVPVDHWSDPNR